MYSGVKVLQTAKWFKKLLMKGIIQIVAFIIVSEYSVIMPK